jgi:outer membrane protein OmpA-like peptidoglycan-associated protein
MKKMLLIIPLLLVGCTSAESSKDMRLEAKPINIETSLLKNYKNKDRFVIDLDLYFDHNSISLNDDLIYNDIVSALSKDRSIRVLVSGHANALGEKKYNKVLSKERVLVVIKEIESKGIASDRISFDYFGEDKPRCKVFQHKNKQCDRRVTVYLYK